MPGDYTLIVDPGVTLRLMARTVYQGTVRNRGRLIIGGWPEKHASGFTKGGTLVNLGTFNNEAGTITCFTNSYLENKGQIVNNGTMDIDCKLTQETGTIDNHGTLFLDQGTKNSRGYMDRTIHDGKFFMDQASTFNNNGHTSQGNYTSVVNRGTVKNYNQYMKHGGAFRNWGSFLNICAGSSPGLTMTEGNAAESRPCDKDGDGIPDGQDQCPNQPEIFNGLMDSDGCPDASGSSG